MIDLVDDGTDAQSPFPAGLTQDEDRLYRLAGALSMQEPGRACGSYRVVLAARGN